VAATTTKKDPPESMLRWQSYREPLYITLARTAAIALIVGAALASWRGEIKLWPLAALLVLWPSFGGHWVEIFFLNWLRPRLPAARAVQVAARLAVWFVGGCVLAIGMAVTAMALITLPPIHGSQLWLAGVGFIGVELLAHLFLQLRGQPSFYNGRG
jgi:hypothetical protein